jgi:lipopolysaccharide export system permease protein
MDLSALNKSNLEEQSLSDFFMMQNASELRYSIDSLNKNYKNDVKTFVENMEVGGVYIVNNIVRHSVVNGSDDYRYNLTMRYHRISFLNPGIIS